MTTKLTKAYTHLTARRDAGQGALEYIGILAVVVVVIGLAIAGFEAAEGDITEGISNLVQQVVGGGGE